MQIKIAERLSPFSHLLGTFCVLPRSALRLQIFPALIIVDDLSHAEPKRIAEITVPVKGPIKEFTVQLDLEKGVIHVWGECLQGYFRYMIFAQQDPFQIGFQLIKGLSYWSPDLSKIQVGNYKNLSVLTERLSLGNHKSQDWEGVKRRANLVEIFPSWLRLGQLVETPENVDDGGSATLLKACEISSKMEVYDSFLNLFKVAFEGILSPSLDDVHHQGWDFTPPRHSLSPLILLSRGAKAIRSLFLRCHQNEIFVLPNLPPQFHCGRYLQVQCGDLGLLDLEWTKKMIRCMVFHAKKDIEINFHFPKEIKKFRLNGDEYQSEQLIAVKEGETYVFDRFQK